jgi:hypothetical protein
MLKQTVSTRSTVAALNLKPCALQARQEIVFLLCIENSEGYLEEAVALSGISCDNMMIIESDSIRQFDDI